MITGLWKALAPWTGFLVTFKILLVGIISDSDIPVGFSGPLSKALTRLICGVTSVFCPYLPIFPTTLSGDPGCAFPVSTAARLCVHHRKRWVLLFHPRSFLLRFPVGRIFSSTLLPGFSGPASSVICTNLPPSVPLPLRGFLIDKRFMTPSDNLDARSGGLPWVRRTASPDAVQLHTKEISPDMWSRSPMPARPSPQRHIAGLLFATYLGSTSYYLRTSHFWSCPCLVGIVLPSGNGARFTSRLRLEGQQVRHARRTWI